MNDKTQDTGPAIPVDEVKNIVENYDKTMAVLVAWDMEHQQVHTVTYSKEDRLKAVAAHMGKAFNELAGGEYEKATHFETLAEEYDEEKVIEAMRTHGGSFVKALAEAYIHADPINKQMIKETWAKYWNSYVAMAKK
jgi:hypothetical protein